MTARPVGAPLESTGGQARLQFTVGEADDTADIFTSSQERSHFAQPPGASATQEVGARSVEVGKKRPAPLCSAGERSNPGHAATLCVYCKINKSDRVNFLYSHHPDLLFGDPLETF